MCPEQYVTHVSGVAKYELGGLGGTRTPDALLRTEALYPLSYEAAFHPIMDQTMIGASSGSRRQT